MKEFEVNTWLWSETNVNWSKKMIKETEQIGPKLFDNFKTITSSTDDPANWKQPRGHVLD
eukprot:12750153-Ditylum_brightwellii.AAC.2